MTRAGAPGGGALTSRGFFRDLGASAPGTGGERALQGQPTRGLQPGGRSRCMAPGLGGHQGSWGWRGKQRWKGLPDA